LTLGDKVKALRTQMGWTRAQLERASGVQYNTIKRLEDGLHITIRFHEGLRLARSLGVTAEKLMEGVDEEKPKKKNPEK